MSGWVVLQKKATPARRGDRMPRLGHGSPCKINPCPRLLVEGGVNFCYADESGTGNEPFATMAGIIVDSGRMHLTKGDWAGLLADLSQIVGRPVTELHTADFYSGNGPWRSIDGPGRARVITAILNWLADRKHHIVYAAVDKASYRQALEAGEIPEDLGSIWRFLGFHLILAIQKCSQREKNNKGNTCRCLRQPRKGPPNVPGTGQAAAGLERRLLRAHCETDPA
jgi:hypothetical protein